MCARDDLIRSASAAANIRCCQAGTVSGPRFGGYLPDEVVGHGGYAVVYRAHHRDGGDPVALKVLDERHRRPPHLDRLAREFTFARRLDHPHVVRMATCPAAGPGCGCSPRSPALSTMPTAAASCTAT